MSMSNILLVLTALGAASCLSAQTKLAGGPFVVTPARGRQPWSGLSKQGAPRSRRTGQTETTGVALRAERAPSWD